MTLEVRWLGRLNYADAVAVMESRRERLLAGDDAAALLLCEHFPVITLGRSASEVDIQVPREHLVANGVEVVRSSRGGEVTYHGPGQLMIYPVVRLSRGLVSLLEAVGRSCADIAEALGVSGGEFRRQPAGVWVGTKKIAACGIHIRRRVMIHGFALNLATPARAWQQIVPCGLSERPISSVAELGGAVLSSEEAADRFAPLLAQAVCAAAIALP